MPPISRGARERAAREQPEGQPTCDADLERDLDKQFGPNAVARGREVFAANCARCHSSIPETPDGAFQESRLSRAEDGRNGDARGLAGQRPGDARVRSRHQPLPRAALESHGRARLGGVRLRDAARARARSRRSRSRTTAAAATTATSRCCRCGRTRRSCTTTRSVRSSAASRRTRRTTSTARRTSMRTARRSPADKAPACWAYDPSVEGRFKLTSLDGRTCSIRPSACPRSRASTRTCASRSGPRTWDGKRRKAGARLHGGASRRGRASARMASFQHKALRQRPDPREAQVRTSSTPGSSSSSVTPKARQIAAELRAVTAARS